MTATTLEETSSGPGGERLGIIGERQLIAVQTLEIARLTAHPVALIPETFIAVTGMGPVDSNESGKTSFLSAVALFLGDPEWRITGTGASSVASLLFEPTVAGITTGAGAATEGFIVGLFADPEDPFATAYSVWMKISAGRPYLQVRHGPGVHLATGADDRERHEAAPRVYKALALGPLGSSEYARALYGRSPRVLAYVASRGRVRSRPSLLKLDAGTFSPEEIGDALMALSGRASLFERDQQDRQDLAAKQEELRLHIQASHASTERETEILRQVEARKAIRGDIQLASWLHRASRARAVLDVYARAESATHLLGVNTDDLDELRGKLTGLHAQRDELGSLAGLQQTLILREGEFKAARTEHEEAVAASGGLSNELLSAEQAIRDARQNAADHDLAKNGGAQDARDSRDDLIGRLAIAEEAAKQSDQEVADAEQVLAEAAVGHIGVAGSAVRAIEACGLAVKPLAESVNLEPGKREIWEARLFPWRDAVCVDERQLEQAVAALEGLPGSIVVAGPTIRDQCSTLPDGILAAPDTAVAFLAELASHTASQAAPVYARASEASVYIVGGFEAPVIGREELLAYYRQRLAAAKDRARAAHGRVGTLATGLKQALITVQRSEAAELVALLQPKINDLTTRLANHRTLTLPPLAKAHDEKSQLYHGAKTAVEDHATRRTQIQNEIAATEKAMREKTAEAARLTAATRPADAVLAAWGRGLDAARVCLNWPDTPLTPPEPANLVTEATPPIGVQGAGKPERRQASELLSAARSQLGSALGTTRSFTAGAGSPPRELLDLSENYQETERGGEDTSALIEPLLTLVDLWLTEHADRDGTAHDEVARNRATRAQTSEFVGSKIRELEQALIQTQEAISQRASGGLNAISAALDKLNQDSGGLGAELGHSLTPPSAPDQPWKCRVTPRWRRNPNGPMLAYDNVTNTAQEKLFSIHLVLAALLAAPHPRGRVLILDELADSLGAQHRREVLHAIASVARDHGITVLATCQDSIMVEARPYCREVLYFHYPSRSEALNRPTRMFGLDPVGTRVEMTADDVIEGRGGPGAASPFPSPES